MNTIPTSFPAERKRINPEPQPLAPFPELVEQRFNAWLAQQQKVAEASRLSSPEDQKRDASATFTSPRFTEQQIHWLGVIKNYVALNGAFVTEDPEAYRNAWESVDSNEGVPLAVANRVFGKGQLKPVIEELNEALIA
jgi:hypothetical protein